jgi:hypothetical protein
MIEDALYTAITGDAATTALLSTHCSAPAVFNRFSPEGVDCVYLVYRVDLTSVDLTMDRFNIYIDTYDYGASTVAVQNVVEALENLLDISVLTSDRYSSIRFRRFSGGFVNNSDPRSIQYNVQYSARGSRKKWIDQL